MNCTTPFSSFMNIRLGLVEFHHLRFKLVKCKFLRRCGNNFGWLLVGWLQLGDIKFMSAMNVVEFHYGTLSARQGMLDSQPRPHSLNLQGPRSGSEELLSDIADKVSGSNYALSGRELEIACVLKSI